MKYFVLNIFVFIGLLTSYHSAFSQAKTQTELEIISEKERQAQRSSNFALQNEANRKIRQDLNGTLLSELNFEDIHGNTYTLESLKGQVVVINFWFIHCKPCVEEIPDLNFLKSEFHDENVKFIAIALDKKVALERFLEKTKFDFTIIPNGRNLSSSFGIPHYPFHVIIDKTGKLHYISDAISLDMMKRLKRHIKKFIKQNA